ncbi:MAG: thiamine pyrophosphate-binding protein [Marinobacter sp.]|uniref:thiamine pyrophosphate-binding protein n=1 Tax=Marinobacter sp. TaxID=50741 RepID=UPI00299E9288|nr:thiamine pyrophosphate-binding protein [Marinobacter sp.]MDX1755072.1 thiamine pyrophosphate-binding protein [Marinobacter sp.]
MIENGDLILSYLERLGVEYVFGVPGGSIEPLFNALARSERRGGIRPIIARHETGAAFMAEGYARETGKLGVCCSTSGPGATNMLTGVASAYTDGIPMLVITAQTSLERFGQGSFQETSCTGINTVEMFSRCTRYNTLVSHSAQLEQKLLQAISHTLSNQPGPAHLSIPLDVMRQPVVNATSHESLRAFINHDVAPSQGAMHLILKDLATVTKVTVVLGEGAVGAIDELLALVEARGWQLVTTPRGKGLVNSDHPAHRGVFGFAGHGSAMEALKPENAERVLVIGTALDEVSTCGWDPTTILSDRMIHLSDNPEHLIRSTVARLVVLGSPRLMLKPFAKLLASDPVRMEKQALTSEFHSAQNVKIDNPEKCSAIKGPIKPQALMTHMSQVCPPESRVLMDTGNSFLWGIHYWNIRKPQSEPKSLFHIGISYASMGWAIGTSVGMAAASRNTPVVCFTGDGSVLMSGQEITTALQENLNLLMVVLNDSALGMVRHGQALSGGEQIGNALPQVNFADLAKALGVKSHRIETMEELRALDVPAILREPGPCVLDVIVDGDEVPPMGARMKVLTGAV